MVVRDIIIAGMLAVSAPAFAQTADAPDSTDAAARPNDERALELATLLSDRDLMMAGAARSYASGFRQIALADPATVALDEAYPGLIDRLIEVSQPVVLGQMERRLPELWRRQAELFAAELTPSEIEDAIAFYASPAGRKMMTALGEHYDEGPLMDDMMENPDYKISGEALTAGIAGAIPGIIREMDAGELRALFAFSRQPVFAKVKELGPRSQAINATWANEQTEEAQAEIDALMAKTIDNHLAAADAKSSGG